MFDDGVTFSVRNVATGFFAKQISLVMLYCECIIVSQVNLVDTVLWSYHRFNRMTRLCWKALRVPGNIYTSVKVILETAVSIRAGRCILYIVSCEWRNGLWPILETATQRVSLLCIGAIRCRMLFCEFKTFNVFFKRILGQGMSLVHVVNDL